jgi:plasmid maintenance system antidote protein VapI
MSKKVKSDSTELEEYLRGLVQTSERNPFTTEEISQILTRHGIPKDLSSHRNDNLVELMKQLHAEQLARAEANFHTPERMHTLGELLESTLILKGLFISQLAKQIELAVEEIENLIENRPLRHPLGAQQLVRLAEVAGLALTEIQRIAAETATRDRSRKDPVRTQNTSSKQSKTYPTNRDRPGMGMIRDSED